MIPERTYAERLDLVRTHLRDAGVPGLVVFARPRSQGGGGLVEWLAGWTPARAPSWLVVPAEGPVTALAAGPNERRVFAQALGARGTAAAPARLAELLPRARIATVGEARMTLADHELLTAAFPERLPMDTSLDALRLPRTPEEVELHKRGAEISGEMIRTAMETAARPGATPADILVETEFTGRRLGADLSGLWLATGERPPTTWFELRELPATLGPRDRVQLGTTIAVEGHFAQVLRTGVRGGASPAMQQMMDNLVALQDAALETLVAGAPLRRLGDALEAGIDRLCAYSRTEDPFRFQSCHVLGVDYAEPAAAPALDPARDRSCDDDGPRVQEGMVIEIHPNFTDPELGHVCIGDMALVTRDGPVWLSPLPRALIDID